MNIREIITKHLKDNGFDGLCECDCGCEASDLAPCSESILDCKPGYKVPCDPETCPADGDCNWHISTEKPV